MTIVTQTESDGKSKVFRAVTKTRGEDKSSNGHTCSGDNCLKGKLPLFCRDFLLFPVVSRKQEPKRNLLHMTNGKKTKQNKKNPSPFYPNLKKKVLPIHTL